MKFDEFDFGLFTVLFGLMIIPGVLAYGYQQQRVLFQHTYNKNLECRQVLKGEMIKRVNEICGTVPQIKDFVGGN